MLAMSGEIERHDPDVVRGIERVTGETYDRERDSWTRRPAGDDLAAARDVFLAASIAVWREIDRLDAEPEGYHPVRMSVELRKTERAAWEKYRDLLDSRPATMLQPVTFGADGDDEARRVPMHPVSEDEDVW